MSLDHFTRAQISSAALAIFGPGAVAQRPLNGNCTFVTLADGSEHMLRAEDVARVTRSNR